MSETIYPRSQRGPVVNSDGIPYNYIVIIDAGSKGSRVFVYNWLNPEVLLKQHNVNLNTYGSLELNMVARLDDDENPNDIGGGGISTISTNADDNENYDDDDDDDDDEDDNVEVEDGGDDDDSTEDKKPKEVGKVKDDGNSKGSNSNDPKKKKVNFNLPPIHTNPKWHRKIKPGIATFKDSPQKVGKHHIEYLLKKAETVVPKSQQSRTPIFLHSTAGMRLLTPTEQSNILKQACTYIQKKSQFYLPDCDTHVNIIDGDIEGIYGWLAVNYLKGVFDYPENHNHGKNHHTYGLLDMGGASTQVAFQPNTTEIEEHTNSLYKIRLASIGSYRNDIQYSIYSDSFLGFGMYQAHDKYLAHLINKNYPESKFIDDPCLPYGYATYDNEIRMNLGGTGDFAKCMESLFPVLENTTYSTTMNNRCNKNSITSSCLLNDLVPALDFDINHFIGVSGYWDALTNLLNYDVSVKNDFNEAYNYTLIYNQTEKICKTPWEVLKNLNKDESDKKLKPKTDLNEIELSELCFKSSWILNILHLGLGFPRFGIDQPVSSSDFKSFQVADKLQGSEFSWTLGRALLYANAEFANASAVLNNLEHSHYIGYYYGASEAVFHHGAEQPGIPSRPEYIDRTTDPYYFEDFENTDNKVDDEEDASESSFTIENHRLYGSLVFLGLLLIISYLMLGHKRRRSIYVSMKEKVSRFRSGHSRKYSPVSGHGGVRSIFPRDMNSIEEEGNIGFELDDYSKSDDSPSPSSDFVKRDFETYDTHPTGKGHDD